MAKMKTQTLSENVNRNPQKHVDKGSPSILSTKTPKTKNELCFDGRKNASFVEKRQNRPSGVRLSGVNPKMALKTPKT